MNLAQMSITRLRIVLPMLNTQSLFDAYVGLHVLMRKFESIHNKWVDRAQNNFLRKAGIIETELRQRCVTKKITHKRKMGYYIGPREKVNIHTSFSRFLKKYREVESGKKSFYFKRK